MKNKADRPKKDKKSNYKLIIAKTILCILIFTNFITIFGFSEQNGEQSTGLSRKITLDVLNTFGEYEEPLTEKQEAQVLNVEYIIRKLAHFSIYAVLGLLLMSLAITFDYTNKKRILLCLLIGILYASLDEFHQSFTPGRTALVTDVLIDTLGVITGSLIVYLITRFICKRKSLNINTKETS